MSDSKSEVETNVQRCYSTWGETYYRDYYGENAPYPPVHINLLRELIINSGAKSVIDAGCGPASFLRHLTGDNLELYGFDLTAEMVSEAKRVMTDLGFNPNQVWQGSVLKEYDYRRPSFPLRYDAAICFGVLPHIPVQDDETVLQNLFNSVSPGGLVIVEARNALFSLFTQNRYTYEFVRDELIRSEELIAYADSKKPEITEALVTYQKHFRMDLPPTGIGKTGEPGYDQVLSRTHNPLVLAQQFTQMGFQNVQTLFYHFHALPPMFAGLTGDFFKAASVRMESPRDWRGYFMASAFIITGTRP